MARAMPARLAMPPEISAGMQVGGLSARPTRPRFTRATAMRPSAGRSVNISSGSMTFSNSVIEPNKRARLEHDAEHALRRRAARAGRRAGHAMAGDLDRSGGGWQQADQLVQQRRFAAARAAQDDEDLAGRDLERHVAEDRPGAEVLRHLVDADDWLLGCGRGHRWRHRHLVAGACGVVGRSVGPRDRTGAFNPQQESIHHEDTKNTKQGIDGASREAHRLAS